jgi:hypothetical protein
MADVEGFDERYPLNSRLVKRDGAIVEEVYRVGGLYDRTSAKSFATSRLPFRMRPNQWRRRCGR